MKPPRFIGVFPSQFPSWTPDGERVDADGMFATPFGYSVSRRFFPVGVSAIDADGQCWVLVDDYGIKETHSTKRLRWKVFTAEVAE